MDGVPIRIGAQSRELRATLDAVERAELLCGGEDLRQVLQRRSKAMLFRIAAALFFSRDGKKVTPDQVKAWCREQPTKIPELERAVAMAVTLHLHETGEVDEEQLKLVGEAMASADSDGAGTNSSAPAAASASIREPREG